MVQVQVQVLELQTQTRKSDKNTHARDYFNVYKTLCKQIYIYTTKFPSITLQISYSLVQLVVGVSLDPAVACDPRGPVNLDLLRKGTERFL